MLFCYFDFFRDFIFKKLYYEPYFDYNKVLHIR